MKMILIDIPLADYDKLLQHCDATRPEYELLKNGIITRDRRQEPAVEILCEAEDAKMILDFANVICPKVVAHVQEGISLARLPQSIAREPDVRRGA